MEADGWGSEGLTELMLKRLVFKKIIHKPNKKTTSTLMEFLIHKLSIPCC